MYGGARKQDKDEGGGGVWQESSFQRQDMGIESVWERRRQIREVDKRRWEALIKQGRMTASYAEDDLVTSAHGHTWFLSCVLAFVEFSHVLWSVRDIGIIECLCMYAHTHIQWRGAEGSSFQHQQVDKSLGPNSLEAELALLLFFRLLLSFFSVIF